MNSPDTERLLASLAQEPQPKVSPYFGARLRRAIENESEERARTARIRRLVFRYGVALLFFSVVLLWRYPYLRWIIPVIVSQFFPDEWLGWERPRARRRI